MPHACYNRPDFADSREVQNGMTVKIIPRAYRDHIEVVVPNMEVMPDRGTRDCCYTLSNYGQADPDCVGCSRRKQVA